MEKQSIVLMLKNPETGFLDKELAIIDTEQDINLICSAFVEEENGVLYVHMKLTCGADLSDEDFERVYDGYGDGCDFENVESIIEEDDCYYPTWEMIFKYDENREVLEAKIAGIISMHQAELNRLL